MQNSEKERSQREALASLLNNASIDCMIALNSDFEVTVWNKMCENVSAFQEPEVIGKKLQQIFPILKRSNPFNNALEQALKGFKSFLPAEQCTFMGEFMEAHIIPLKEENDEIAGVMILLHDVAHRQKAEMELKRLNSLLASKNRDLENRNLELISFSRLSSHDLKGPLRKIQVFSKMLWQKEEHNLSEEGKLLFNRIQKSAKKAEQLNDDILRFTLIQKFGEPMVRVLPESLLTITRHKLQARIETSHAEIRTGALPAVEGYKALLQQLFDNILENALKFQEPSNKPFVMINAGDCSGNTLTNMYALPDTHYKWISFEDNGIGFDPQYSSRIFDLFEKLNRHDEYPGNGIGLSICRKIMELHQGFIEADSEPGKGSKFTCYFPESPPVL
jgi:signal transduction histidine kinase